MAQIPVRDWNNKTLRTLELDEAVFGYPLKEHLIYEAVCAYRAGGRRGTHKIKNRSEVSGGTKKLWKQKHTGRARVGDNRSPLWRHGGTVHGPVPRDYSWNFPAAMRRNAIKSALAQKLRDGQIVCVDGFALATPKTKDLEGALSGKLGVTKRRCSFRSRPMRTSTSRRATIRASKSCARSASRSSTFSTTRPWWSPRRR